MKTKGMTIATRMRRPISRQCFVRGREGVKEVGVGADDILGRSAPIVKALNPFAGPFEETQ